MATYVISDIHGFYYRFQDLLKQVNFNNAEDELYILGDIIDRGPHNKEIIEWAYNRNFNVYFLLGNHEDMMLSVLNRYSEENFSTCSNIWALNGGYNTYFDLIKMWPQEKINDFLNWVREWPMFFDIQVNNKRFVLVHAGLALNGIRRSDDYYRYGRKDIIDIPEFNPQWAQSLLWIRDTWYYDLQELPCDVIFGHTGTSRIYKELIWFNEDLTWFNDDFKKEQKQEIKIEGSPNHSLHINNQKHAIDTGREIMGILRLDDMVEFYSTVQEEKDNE